MKKHFIVAGKAFGFIILWGVSLSVVAIPEVNTPSFLGGEPAFLRLWWELIPLLGILFATAVFVLGVEKNRVKEL